MSISNNTLKQAFSARKKRQIAKHPELYPQYNTGKKHNDDNTNEASAKALEGLIQKVKGKAFFNWSVESEEHRRLYESGKCDCFYCTLGWLKKNDSPLPLWDYEQVLQDTIENKSKYILIRKSTGLGITSFWLYYWIYRALQGHLMNKEVAIIVGPSQQLAIDLISKIRSYFLSHGIKFDSRATTLTINGCTFNSKPSNHLDSLRSRMDLKVIIVDELDYLVEAPERAILRDVIERYLAKTDPYIILISTPGKDPNTSLMKQIEDEGENSIYHKFVLDWTTGYNKIYSDADIAIAKRSPSWEREYCAQYGGWSGNVHSPESIHRAVEIEGKKYYPKSAYTANARHIVSIDPGYTEQSKFGVCVLQLTNGKAQVLLADSYANVDIVKGVDFTVSLMRKYLPCNAVFVDGANVPFIASLKRQIGEDPLYQDRIKQLKHEQPATPLLYFMKVLPVDFGAENETMLSHAVALLSDERGLIQIHPSFTKLIDSLKSASTKDNYEYRLDKRTTVESDVYDAFRMALTYIVYRPARAIR